MSAVDELAEVVAKNSGRPTSIVRDELSKLDEQQAQQLLNTGVADAVGDSTRSFREELGLKAVETALDQPSRAAESVTEGVSKTTLGSAGLISGGAVGTSYFLTEGERAQAQEAAEKSQALEGILNDPQLSTSEKQDLIDQLTNSGFFADQSEQGSGGGFLGNLFNFKGLDLFSSFVLLLVIYFAGKALVNAANSGGGNGGSN